MSTFTPALPPGQVARALSGLAPHPVSGQVRRVLGLEATAVGLRAAVGDLVTVHIPGNPVPAEVVALSGKEAVLAPLAPLDGAVTGTPVHPAGAPLRVTCGPDLIGRVVDALGRPLDDGPPLTGEPVEVANTPPPALARQRITAPMPLGVKVVDTLLTCATGQRVGIFAGSGVGKSTLLGMLARGAEADVVVLALIGERGREVREFLEDDLGPGGAARAVTVVATSDEPPLMRLKAAHTATRVAEWFRDQGKSVLLLMDSLTRFAMAAREIGLAAGEPPVSRGYTPSVFTALPQLLERTGPGPTGTITALYTVLVEGDDMNDPIADSARSILDGHIVLSRRLAAAGHYPTVDVLASASRLAGKILPAGNQALAAKARALLAAAEDGKDLVAVGAYKPGANPELDEALAKAPALRDFLRQDVHEVVPATTAWGQLAAALN